MVRLAAACAAQPATDLLAVEEPLEVRVNGRALAVIMRTPGNDAALARGFLLTEGIVERPEQIAALRENAGGEEHPQNVVAVELTADAGFNAEEHARQFFATSSCGICGKSSLEAVRLKARPVVADWKLERAAMAGMPEAMRAGQRAFAQTGSLHAAALFGRDGRMIDLAEDVGRHNAVDKVIGRAAERSLGAKGSRESEGDGGAAPWPLGEHVLMVSGRISFEITQKALMAGIGVVGAVSGATSLAVELAEEQGMTLVGFVRGETMTVYAGPWRLLAS